MSFAVLTHHKCASNWLIAYSRRLAELNGLSLGATHQSDVGFADAPDIAVVINASYGFARQQDWTGVHVVRNPLDLICSAYYSHRDTHLLGAWSQLKMQREILQSVSKSEGMLMTLAFLERVDFDFRVIGPFLSLRCWNYADEAFATLRMEDVVADVDTTLGAAFRAHFGPDLILPEASDFVFEAFSRGRKPGELDSRAHYRLGRAGVWLEDLPESAVRYIRLHLGDLLRRFYPECVAAVEAETAGA
jgi:hypothetical protein